MSSSGFKANDVPLLYNPIFTLKTGKRGGKLGTSRVAVIRSFITVSRVKQAQSMSQLTQSLAHVEQCVFAFNCTSSQNHPRKFGFTQMVLP